MKHIKLFEELDRYFPSKDEVISNVKFSVGDYVRRFNDSTIYRISEWKLQAFPKYRTIYNLVPLGGTVSGLWCLENEMELLSELELDAINYNL